MSNAYWIVLACGVLAILYGIFASRSVLSSSGGNEKMQEIAGAIQEGAQAYLNRQYMTIGMVGVVVGVILGILLGIYPAMGFSSARSCRGSWVHRNAYFGARQCADG